jgi:hypothetical protein
MDITYIPMARGFVYLAVVLDWFSRRVLSWHTSITMEAAFCVETLEDAMAHHGKPEIFNTDRGSQFTGSALTSVLATNGIAISMDGNGAWRDNDLRRTAVAQRQLRGGVSQTLRQRVRGARVDRALPRFLTPTCSPECQCRARSSSSTRRSAWKSSLTTICLDNNDGRLMLSAGGLPKHSKLSGCVSVGSSKAPLSNDETRSAAHSLPSTDNLPRGNRLWESAERNPSA